MTPPPTAARKQALRQALLARRDAAFETLGPAAARALIRPFTRAFHPIRGTVVAGYWPMRGELDPRPLMRALAMHGCRLALPTVAAPAEPLQFRRWRDGDPLEPGPHGTAHPPTGTPTVTPDVVLVPMLGFDKRGLRLGYGGGYYDRTLARLRARGEVLAVGLAYSAQEVQALPIERHDQPLDGLATERGARHFAKERPR